MVSVGGLLAAERKRRGIDLKDVERQTRIHARYLLAIENDDWDTLPAGAYVRAFVASYARFLGLDPQPLLGEMREAQERQERPAVKRSSRWEKPAGPSGGRKRRALGNRLPLAVVLAGLVGFGFLLGLPQNQQRTSAPTAGAPGSAAGTTTTRPPAAGSAGSPRSPAPVETSSTSVPPGDSVVKGKGAVSLRLVVREGEGSWVRIVADGRNTFEGVLSGGDQREWSARRRLYVRVGDAGAIRAFLNDERLPKLGDAGEVVDRVFSSPKREGDG